MTDHAPVFSCPVCGAKLSTGAQGAWCPHCAMAGAFADTGAGSALFTVPGHLVLAELGRGAAGIVYRARQKQPGREVALKIMRPHEAGSEESRARFRLEAVALAGLDHPLILPVFNVGEHDGLPYFTMKLCAGGSLAERLGRFEGRWREIAQLVATLADAVHYAHVRGVLHRDLKPGNVLFDENDRPFVSDFGLAKLLEASAGGGPVTRPLLVLGTPGYLAPEVLAGGAGAATTGADVYALGAMLLQLITGEPPSTTPLSAVGRPGVPRDLAVIAEKCLRAEPAARYASAGALAEDLRAWLSGRAIAARPLSAAGQAAAWARRNPALAGVSAAAFLLLVVVAVVSTAAAVRLDREQRATTAALARAEAEQRRAATEAATSKAIADFLQNDLLAQASPENQPDRDLKLRTMLDRAAGKIENRFRDEPLVEASIQTTLAQTYRGLGEFAPMQRHLEEALAIRRKQLGEDAPPVLAVMSDLVLALTEQGKYPEAETLGRQTLAAQQRVLGRQHPDVLTSMINLETVLQHEGHVAEAETILVEALATAKQALGAEHATTLQAMNDLAYAYRTERKFDEAVALYRQTLDLRRKVLGPEHPDTLSTMINLGSLYRAQGNFADAEATFAQLLETSRRVLGPEHPTTLAALNNLAVTSLDRRKFDQAAALFAQVLEISRRTVGPEHPNTLRSMNNLAAVYRSGGKLPEAEALYVETLGISRRLFGAEHIDTSRYMQNLATVYQLEGKYREAETLLAATLDLRRRLLGPAHDDTLTTQENLGTTRSQLGKFAEAEPLLRAVLQARTQAAPDGWQVAVASSEAGEAVAGQQRFAEAEPLLLAGYEGLRGLAGKTPPAAKPELPRAGARLVKFYTDWGKPAEAEAWRQKFADPKTGP